MAAFTSLTSGNWNVNGTWTTAGYPGDGVSGVADTWTILDTHVVTMPWGAPLLSLPFTVGSGVINLGGELVWAAGFTSAFSTGNITVTGKLSAPSDANAKVMWMGNGTTNPVITVSNANTAEMNTQKSTRVHFHLLTRSLGGIYVNTNGKFTMEGTSSASKDCQVTGTAGLEPYVIILGNTTAAAKGGINNATFNYCGRYSASYAAALNLASMNAFNNNFTIGNIDITNVNTLDHGLYLRDSKTYSGAGIITASTPGANIGMYLLSNVLKGGTFNGTSNSGYGIYSGSVIDGATFNGTSTSGIGVYNGGFMFSGSVTGVSSSNYGGQLSGSIRGGAISLTSSTNIAGYFPGIDIYGGTFTLISTNSTAMYLFYSNYIHGGSLELKNSNTGIASVPGALSMDGGAINIHDCTYSFNLQTWQDCRLQKTGLINIAAYNHVTAAYTNETSWFGIEPLIYKDHASNKTCTIYFPCSPWNSSDFTFAGAGSVSYGGITAGSITITGAGTLTFPVVQPWDVAGWTAITYTVSGGNSPVYEYRWSTDNGSSWSAWTAYTTGVSLAGISCGLNGNDLIQLRATNGAGAAALTLTNFTITLSYARETSPQYSEDAEGPLFFPTYAKCACYFTVWATMPDDATSVIATLHKDDGSLETLTSAVATQKAGTSQWYWSTSNITTQPTTLTHYRVQFKDQNNNKVFRDLYFGGTEDDIIKTRINAGLIPALL